MPNTTPLNLPVSVTVEVGPPQGWGWNAVTPTPVPVPMPAWGWATGRAGRAWAVSGAPSIHAPSRLTGPPPIQRPSRPSRLPGMVRDKLREWGRRYLLAEIGGTLAALTAALTVHALTGSLATAALAGSVAESIAYYSVVLRRLLPALYAKHAGVAGPRRLLLTARSTVTELSDFLAAEVADTLVLRPGLIYLAAGWAGSGMVWGLLIGKLLADVGFYTVVIPSYELRKRLIHR